MPIRIHSEPVTQSMKPKLIHKCIDKAVKLLPALEMILVMPHYYCLGLFLHSVPARTSINKSVERTRYTVQLYTVQIQIPYSIITALHIQLSRISSTISFLLCLFTLQIFLSTECCLCSHDNSDQRVSRKGAGNPKIKKIYRQ